MTITNRTKLVKAIEDPEKIWDVIVVGGGATGLGTALDAASRGFKTLLLEQADFAKGTSSRSTKLVHGGVRYLAKGDISLVWEALYERGLLLANAPHLVKSQSFLIPSYEWWGRSFYAIGLTVYDLMARKLGLGRTRSISKKEVLVRLPNINPIGLYGATVYYDGQFDDSRLAINLVQTCLEQGATALNYFKVSGLDKNEEQKIKGVKCTDIETGVSYSIKGVTVINATGVFVDDLLQMDDPLAKPMVRPSQGIHLVIDKSFLPGDDALMIPKTEDGRVLFAVPWHDKIVLGTTDTLVKENSLEPQARKEEIDFILRTAAKYLAKAPLEKDVLSVFAGLRPLAVPKDGSLKTKEISRSHKLFVSASGLITITGGKWTTYRRMAEDTVDKAIAVGNLRQSPCLTRNLHIHGSFKPAASTKSSANLKPSSRTKPSAQTKPSARTKPSVQTKPINNSDHLNVYGSDQEAISNLLQENAAWGEQLHSSLPYTAAEVVWGVRNEMARTVEDILARRLRALFLDANASIEMAPQVASLIARELNRDIAWEVDQVSAFKQLSSAYLVQVVQD